MHIPPALSNPIVVPPQDPLPFAPSSPKMTEPQFEPKAEPATITEQQTQVPNSPRLVRARFDPLRPSHASQIPLAPPPQDARVPTADSLRGMLFRAQEDGQLETPITSVTPAQTISPVQTTINPALTISTPTRPTSARSPTTPTRPNPGPKSLSNAYAASLPPLPALPADLAKKVAGVKVRRRGLPGAGVNWGGSGTWTGPPIPGGAVANNAVLGPGGAGAQGWWASVSGESPVLFDVQRLIWWLVGQAPPPGVPASSVPQPGMELLRWQAILQINPAHVFARRPTKIVTTHEWRVSAA